MKIIFQKKIILQLSIILAVICIGIIYIINQEISNENNEAAFYKEENILEKEPVRIKKDAENQDLSLLDIQSNTIQTSASSISLENNDDAKRLAYEKMMREHPYSNRIYTEVKSTPKFDRPDLAWEQDFLRTLDPSLGYVPSERMEIALEKTRTSKETQTRAGITGVTWTEKGPNDIGGRTRALMFDPNDVTNKKVWAGAISGGLWVNSDIISASTSWTKIDDLWDNLSISTIAYDPNNTQNFYLGTGEGWGNGGAVRGGGMYKSSNGGTNWSRLTSTIPAAGTSITESFYYVQKVVVNSSGHIFAATRGLVSSRGGILKSIDGGTSWTRVLAPLSGIGVSVDATMRDWAADIEIASNGDLYASTGISSAGKVYRSTDGGTSWTEVSPGTGVQRIELAIAPSASSATATTVLYAVAYSGVSGNNDVSWLKKSTNGGTTWTDQNIPLYREQSCTVGTKHFTRAQAWYDLILAVHPTDPNVVVAGGIDLHRTTDGGTTWTNVSYWTGSCKPYVHADQHIMTYRPGSSNEMIFGNDGGVSYSTNVGDASNANPTFNNRNKDYNVTQFYACAMKNQTGVNYFLGGAQDNGTLQITTASAGPGTDVNGGDGAFCFIDQNDPNIQIVSYVFNNYTLLNSTGGFVRDLISDSNLGSFINPSDYDDVGNILYSAKSSTQLYKVSGVGSTNTLSSLNASGIGTVTHVRVGKSTNTVFVGNSSGKVYRLTNTNTTTATVTDISTGLPSGSISCVEVGITDDELLVTLSNFGVSSVWYSNNAGTSWVNKDNDLSLPDMPVRWALFNPGNRKNVIIATETGVWSTTDITAANPGWAAISGTLPNVRTDMFQYRSSDNLVLVATYGRGLYTANFFSASVLPPAPTITSFSPTQGGVGGTVTITGTNYTLTPSGNLVKFNGTTANVVSSTNTTVTVTIPDGASTGKITVTTEGGTATSTNDFNVVSSINSFSPTTGIYGDAVIINGSGFSNVVANNVVKFNGVTATVTAASGSQIITSVPFGSTTGKITITIGVLTLTSATDFVVSPISALNPNLNDEVAIYPNPTNDFINVKLGESGEVRLLIYDQSGQTVYEESALVQKDELYSIDIRNLNKGSFFLKIISKEGEKIHRFIKE